MRGRRYIVRDSREEGKVVPSELQRERRAGLDPVDEALAARQVDLEVLGPLLAVSAGSARMERRRIGNFLKVIVEFRALLEEDLFRLCRERSWNGTDLPRAYISMVSKRRIS